MRVLQIGASWFGHQLTGLERYYTELLTYLPSLGMELTAVAYELKDGPNIDGLNLVSFGTQKKSIVRQFVDQRRTLRPQFKNGLDLVVSHCTPSIFPSLSDLGDKPLICHFHGPRYLERTLEGANSLSVQLSKYIENRVYGRTNYFITLSHYMKRLLVETYSVAEDKISVIPGGVDINQFSPHLSRAEARARLELHRDRPIILAVRRLERRMGLHNLIDAMSKVVRIEPNVLLLIAGRGTLQDQLLQHIHARKLSEHIELLGAIPDQVLPLLYRSADFSIVPTLCYEGFGLILAESLACGTPALGTPVGAIPEVLRPLSSSLLLESVRPEHLSEGIVEALVGDRTLPSAQECQQYAAEKYAWPVIAKQVHAVYHNIVASCRPNQLSVG